MKLLQKILTDRRAWLSVFLLSTVLGLYLHWPALSDPYRIHDNWRQSPHWINPERQQFQENDLILEYARFNTSPFSNFLYPSLARLGPDLLWGKIMALIFFSTAVTLVFLTARRMYGQTGAWFSALIFALLPCQFAEFCGGFMSALSASLLILAVFLIHTRHWWLIPPLMIFQTLSYPMAALHTGMILVMDFIWHDGRRLKNPELWKSKILPLSIAAAAVVILILGKYLFADHPFGEIAGPDQIGNRPEFTRSGRYPLIPIPALWEQLAQFWGHGFYIVIILIGLVYLGTGILTLPRGLYALLTGSVVMYKLSEYLVMKLYIPDRYLHFSLPLFFALSAGWWLQQIVVMKRHHTRLLAGAGLVLLIAGLAEFRGSLEPGLKTYRYHRQELYAAIEKLPGRPLLAAPPRRASELSVMTGKSVLVSQEMCHPWWSEYWNEMSRRSYDFYQAYYATEPEIILTFLAKYDIDYMIIEHNHFKRGYINRKKPYCMEPFNQWLRVNHIPNPYALLAIIPNQYFLYDHERRGLVSRTSLEKWLKMFQYPGSQDDDS